MPTTNPSAVAWLALIAGSICELILVIFLRRAEGKVGTAFAIACGIAIVGCFLVSYASRSFQAGTVYIMWVGAGGLLITLYGMSRWGESRDPLRFLAIALVIVGLGILKFTAKPREATAASTSPVPSHPGEKS